MTIEDEVLLLELLNSAPLVDGAPVDELSDARGAEFARRWGGSGTAAEIIRLRRTRDALHALVRGGEDAGDDATTTISDVLREAVRVPTVSASGIGWDLRVPDDDRLAVRAAEAWSAVNEQLPGRLRACANDECNLFLLDHSRPGTARWCSMSACGNRMKARAHASRARMSSPTRGPIG